MKGADDLIRKIEKIRINAIKKHARKATKKALAPVKADAVENAKEIDDPKTREKIYQNIQIQSGKSNDKNEIKYRVGVKGGAKQNGSKKRGRGGDTFYWRFVELGTATIPAVPFLRRALASNNETSTEIFGQEMWKGIQEDIRG